MLAGVTPTASATSRRLRPASTPFDRSWARAASRRASRVEASVVVPSRAVGGIVLSLARGRRPRPRSLLPEEPLELSSELVAARGGQLGAGGLLIRLRLELF